MVHTPLHTSMEESSYQIQTLYSSLLSRMLLLEDGLDKFTSDQLCAELQQIERLQEEISETWLMYPEQSQKLNKQERENCFELLKAIQDSNSRLHNKAMARLATLKHDRAKLAQGLRSCQTYTPDSARIRGRIVSVSS